MFMGHYAPAMLGVAAKNDKNAIKLWQGFLAVQTIDLVFAVLVMFGVEDSVLKDGEPLFDIPWSHSLFTSLLIALVAASAFKVWKKSSGWNGFGIIFGLVFSHWVMDLIVHRPDLPFFPIDETVYGFGLWNYPWLAYGLEMGLLFFGFLYWVSRTTPKSTLYKFLPWTLFLFMGLIQFIFITLPGLQIKDGTFDLESQIQGASLGALSLLAFLTLAAFVGWVESGRVLKPAQSSST